MSRKIAVVTGTRAEYGLLYHLMRELQNQPDVQFQLIVTGAHLSHDYGYTVKQIEADGFPISAKVDMQLSGDAPAHIARSMGICTGEMAKIFAQLKPDIVVILGDRYEMLATATAAMVMCVPIAHIHGGESTEGLIDEAIRHSLTKMAQIHFVSTNTYRDRVIQLGEQPASVHLVGALGVDAIRKTVLLSRDELEKSLDFKLGKKNLLITFHPVTLENNSGREQMEDLLSALSELSDTQLIFTMPNADAGGHGLMEMINNFVSKHKNARAYSSLGQQRYLSCVALVDAVVGNSSSGIIEAPSFKKPTINIGNRQSGRVKAESVIDCEPSKNSILAALQKAYSQEFQASLAIVENPYGNGDSCKKIVDTLISVDLVDILKKQFFDIPVPKGP
jgi:GDP/UDP-N,N'-diacetylbacillosamine 2-epimerase (hydrolysing)